ncbi:MAG: hypothetical protein WCI77_01710 [Candidatus Omnitrophota bacterium]
MIKVKSYIIGAFLVIVSLSAFAEDKPTMTPLYGSDISDKELEQKIQFSKDVLKGSGYLETFQLYRAIRDENVSLCPNDECKRLASNIILLRYGGENRCKDIKNNTLQELCVAVNASRCEELKDWRKGFCEATLKNNPDALVQSSNNPELSKIVDLPFLFNKDTVSVGLGIYYGYKHYSSLACERYLKDTKLPLRWKLSCKLIFSQDFEKDKDELLTDLSLFVLSRIETKPALCNRVKNNFVKDACLNANVKDLSEVW